MRSFPQRRTKRLLLEQMALLQQQQSLLDVQVRTLQLRQLELLQQQVTRELLLQALRTMAEAMQRQDDRRQEHQQETRELLLEVLSSLQPTAEAQISQRLGQSTPPSYSHSWAS